MPRVHPCARGTRNPTPAAYRLLPGDDASQFTILEYDSAATVAERWAVAPGGSARPTAGCFSEAAEYVANGNLVVQVPPGSSATPVLDILRRLHRPLPGAPISLLDLALAVEAGGATWTGATEVGLTCAPRPTDSGAGGTPTVAAYQASIGGEAFRVLAYYDEEHRELQWERDADGRASSTDCPHTAGALAAGNLVADQLDGQTVAAWTTVVDALADLHRQRIQPFTTQLLLDGLYARGGAAVVPGAHPCDGVATARLTQGEVFAGRPDTRFWVWEYGSTVTVSTEWTAGDEDRVDPRLACAPADAEFFANRNLVVEIPAASAPEPTRLARPGGLERALEYQPYTLGRIARAIDASELDWRFYGDVRFPCFGPPGERAGDDAGLGVNASIGLPGSTDEESISPIVYVYRSPEGLHREWDVEPDGRASSERCTTFGVGWAAGNVVIAFDPSWVPDPLDVWPRVGAVMQELARQADASASRS